MQEQITVEDVLAEAEIPRALTTGAEAHWALGVYNALSVAALIMQMLAHRIDGGDKFTSQCHLCDKAVLNRLAQ